MNPWSSIYQANVWAGTDSLSGPGSGAAATQHVGPAIVDLCSRYGIRTVIDAACGDGFWMPDLPGYLGIDRAPEAIAWSRTRHPHRQYIVGDLRTCDAQADLIILRDVIQHLSLSEGTALVRAALEKGRYLLASSYRGGHNTGISEAQLMRGLSYDDDLERPPFALGEPLEAIPDGYAYAGDDVRDERKVLGLWRGLR
jgi:hypothetical protein